MRILFASHTPLEEPETGVRTLDAVLGLRASGNSVRALVADHTARDLAAVPTRRVICNAANRHGPLKFELPRLKAIGARMRFSDLTDDELLAYRQAMREALDAEIAVFDPQIIHAAHLWLPAHLALESGVPYVVTAYEQELSECVSDPRYQRLVTEATENAGRVLVADAVLADKVRTVFGDLDDRIVVAPWLAGRSSRQFDTAALVEVYQQVLDERHGHRWRA